MPSTIHKIELQPGVANYSLPVGAELLHAAIQHGAAQLWFKRRVDAQDTEERTILVTGTGHSMPDFSGDFAWKFISTMLTADQNFVFHIFELVDNHG